MLFICHLDLSKKVNEVKEENLKLKSENHILSNYIENLMQTSNVFQSTWQTNSGKTATTTSTNNNKK